MNIIDFRKAKTFLADRDHESHTRKLLSNSEAALWGHMRKRDVYVLIVGDKVIVRRNGPMELLVYEGYVMLGEEDGVEHCYVYEKPE